MKILVTGGRGPMAYAFSTLDFNHDIVVWDSRNCDLTDARAVKSSIEELQPDAILHLAAKSGGAHLSRRQPAEMFRTNSIMALNVMDAAVSSGVSSVGMALSTACYPSRLTAPASEESFFEGAVEADDYAYAYAKRNFVPMLRAYGQQFGIRTFSFVVNGVVGPCMNFREDESVMVASLIRKFSQSREDGIPVEIWGDGSGVREYTSSTDLARASVWCLENQPDGSILNIGSNERVTVREVAEILRKFFQLPSSMVVFDRSKSVGKPSQITNNGRFVQMSNFQFEPFNEALLSAASWYVESLRSGQWIRI